MPDPTTIEQIHDLLNLANVPAEGPSDYVYRANERLGKLIGQRDRLRGENAELLATMDGAGAAHTITTREVERLREENADWKRQHRVEQDLANGLAREAGSLREEVERLRSIIGELYVARGQEVNALRGLIRKAFRDRDATPLEATGTP